MTLCLTQSVSAIFNCVVDTIGIPITDVTWFILDGGVSSPTNGRPYHSVETLPSGGNIRNSTLRISTVSMNDNGAQYRCQVAVGVVSDYAFLTVLGEIIIISSVNI